MKRLLLLLFCGIAAIALHAQTYIERLSRGVVAVPTTKGNFVSWRFLATDPASTSFNLMRDGEVIASDITSCTCFTDTAGAKDSHYSVQTLVGGAVQETSDEVQVWAQPYLSIPLIRPVAQTLPDGSECTFTPNDCSAADVDGDGEYEIILKWSGREADNSHGGYTGEVFIDCYKPEGILMWRVSLGKNIRAGAHYTQFMVYDLDGDGKAEMVCKTAPGSKDGKGDYVTKAATDETIKSADNDADYRAKNGYILDGPEYLTVFSGKDGHAIHTIYYNPNRGMEVGGVGKYADEWGDKGNYGNRGDRFLACVAFLGGKKQNPSVVMCRGYYTVAYLWAVDFDGKALKTRWLHCSPNSKEWWVKNTEGKVTKSAKKLSASAFGQGAHSLAVADVDGDGCDEITYGSAAINNDGTLLYSTGLGHGDAQHLSDLDPDRPGLEYFMVHEARPYGCDLRDAKTGEILQHLTGHTDTGRGISADIDSLHRGAEFWCSISKDVHAVDGSVITESNGWVPQNFRIFWDGDLYEELLGNGGSNQMPGTWGDQGQQRMRGQRGMRGQRNGQGMRGQRGQRNGQWGQRQDFAKGDSTGMQRPPMPMGGDSLAMQRPPMMPMGGDSIRGGRPDFVGMPNGGMPDNRMRNGGMPNMRRQSYWIGKWNGKGVDHEKIEGKDLSEYGNSSSCNGTKSTPCLQADLFGDWREEVILYDASDCSHLNIFTTTIPTPYRVPTLMHDHVYRMGVVWQNVAYNQPPHLGYYLPDLFKK